MPRYISLSTLTPLSLALAIGCSAEDPSELGSVHVKSGVIAADAGGSLVVTAEDYAPYAGARLDVPANALATDTKLTIGLGPDSLMDDDADGAGPAIEFGPSGTQFSTPVTITLPYSGDLDATLARVYVRHADGTREVLLPADIEVDAGVVRVTVDHFTAFQPGRARGACRHVTCPSGQQCQGGQCRQNPGNGGGNNNNGPCQPSDCPSPAPGAPNYTCPDGTIAGPICERNAAGACGWNFVTCPACSSDADCAAGEQCVNGACQAQTGGACGNTTCGNSQYCCNPSCGICAPVGGSCTQQACGGGNPGGGGTPCGSDADCASGELCTAAGVCAQGTRCGNTVCGNSQYCCNASCSICAPPGTSCTQQACAMACNSNADCGALQQCVNGVCQ